MRYCIVFCLILGLVGCAISAEERIGEFKHRCEIIGYEKNSEALKQCVLGLEEQYVAGRMVAVSVEDNSLNNKLPQSGLLLNRPSPGGVCMFNQGENRYQSCYHVTASGACVHYGGPCTP